MYEFGLCLYNSNVPPSLAHASPGLQEVALRLHPELLLSAAVSLAADPVFGLDAVLAEVAEVVQRESLNGGDIP